MDAKKVSVLIPIYNTSQTLARCLDSVLRQTMKDIEIVCVDDGSDEETKSILREYEKKDERIRVITHAVNKGLLYARKTAIEAANSPYCMILDSDDEFYPNACEKAYRTIVDKKADVVAFGTTLICEKGISDIDYIKMKETLQVQKGILKDKKIFETFLTFGGKRSGFNVWNKIYKREILAYAAGYIPEEKCVLAEDFALTFMILFKAKKYFGIKDKLIRYYFGEGVSSPNLHSFSNFKNLIKRETACKSVQDFLDKNSTSNLLYSKTLRDWREDFLRGNLWAFLFNCPKQYSAKVFDLLVQEYGMIKIVTETVKMFGTSCTDRLLKKIEGASCLKLSDRSIKTVAFFYHRYFNGGVERVISILIPLFMKWGYRVVLMLEEEGENEYPLPFGCEKVILPPSLYQNAENYALHVEAFCQIIEKYNIDAVLYQAASSDYLLYDMLAAKAEGIKFYVSMHEIVALPLIHGKYSFKVQSNILLLADGVQTLLRSDEKFLNAYGVNAHFIPNPNTYDVSENISLQSYNIVWVGRFDEFQKRPSDALYIMKEVVKYIPNAHLLMVGTSGNKAADEGYKRLAAELHIEKNVTFCGFRKNPMDFYKASSVLLITSSFESYCLVLLEGMSCGLPIVSYDMPYLETMRNNKGCILVEQQDIREAAQSIVLLLKNEKLRSETAQNALDFARSLAEEDLRPYWEKMLSGKKSEKESDADMRVALETLFDFYGRSFNKTSEPNIVRIGLLYLREHGFRATMSRVRLYVKKHGFKRTLRKMFAKS